MPERIRIWQIYSDPYGSGSTALPINKSWVDEESLVSRAGHATTLPRQSDQKIVDNDLICTVYSLWLLITFRHRDLSNCRIFSWPWSSITLSRCRCREAKQLPCAQPCYFLFTTCTGWLPMMSWGPDNCRVNLRQPSHLRTWRSFWKWRRWE